MFSIYLGPSEAELFDDGNLLLRLSTESTVEASMWIDMLEQSCAMNDVKNIFGDQSMQLSVSPRAADFISAPTSPVKATTGDNEEEDWGHSSLGDTWVSPLGSRQVDTGASAGNEEGEEALQVHPVMLQRVRSSNLILRKSLSRQTLSRRVLHQRAPRDFTQSGHRLSQLVDDAAIKEQRYSRPPPSLPASMSVPVVAAGKEEGAKRGKKASSSSASFPAYKPMHTESCVSPLSSEARPGQYSFRGFFNLGLIILVLSHCDLMINNFDRYGPQTSLSFLFPASSASSVPPSHLQCDAANVTSCAALSSPADSVSGHAALGSSVASLFPLRSALLAVLSWGISIFLALFVEKLASRGVLSNKATLILNVLCGTANLAFPCWWVWAGEGGGVSNPVASMLYLFQSVVIWLKLISYCHANKDLRLQLWRARKATGAASPSVSSVSSDNLSLNGMTDSFQASATGSADGMRKVNLGHSNQQQLQSLFSEVKDLQPPYLTYPQNLTASNLLFFMTVPTLCYQLNYPRTERIRWRYLLSLVLRMIFVGMSFCPRHSSTFFHLISFD